MQLIDIVIVLGFFAFVIYIFNKRFGFIDKITDKFILRPTDTLDEGMRKWKKINEYEYK